MNLGSGMEDEMDIKNRIKDLRIIHNMSQNNLPRRSEQQNRQFLSMKEESESQNMKYWKQSPIISMSIMII